MTKGRERLTACSESITTTHTHTAIIIRPSLLTGRKPPDTTGTLAWQQCLHLTLSAISNTWALDCSGIVLCVRGRGEWIAWATTFFMTSSLSAHMQAVNHTGCTPTIQATLQAANCSRRLQTGHAGCKLVIHFAHSFPLTQLGLAVSTVLWRLSRPLARGAMARLQARPMPMKPALPGGPAC